MHGMDEKKICEGMEKPMNNKIRRINENIQRGNSLEENIPVLLNHLADRYQVLAQVRLAMHYYTFYEAHHEDCDTWSSEALELISRVNQLIREDVLQSRSGAAREEAVFTADSIRQEIINRMNLLTAYTDIFQNYEYVLNRLEYRFLGNAEAFDEDEFAKEILRYIFDTEDNVIINEKIKEILGQLPIRFTKQKYFEILKESLGVYLGAEAASLDTFLYMLRTSAMVYRKDGMDTLYPELWERKEFLSQMNYQKITKNDYEKARGMLVTATRTLETEISTYFGLQEIINEVYTILISAPYTGFAGNDYEKVQSAASAIIRDINQSFLQMDEQEVPEAQADRFHELEGVQEELDIEINAMENVFYLVDLKYKTMAGSLMLDRLMHVLKHSQSLLSDSLFIDLKEEVTDTVVDEERIAQEAAALEKELTQLFASQDRMLSRSVIASTINKVPVFFKNHREVMDYVRYSLERCTDQYEKAACFEIINDIMSQ